MDPRRPDPRPGAMTDLEAKLLAAGVANRLFKRQQDPVQLGRYRLIERLGQGGMGVVFRAHDPQLRRDVAVKLLHARAGAGPEQHARLRREALALGRLSHPNVVQVFEVGESEQHMFVVMELVRGVTLRGWLAERPRSAAEVVAMAGQVGRGLAAAHAAGIVHRDLKPENVLVGADGRARVVDFGLARAAAAEAVGDGASGLAAMAEAVGDGASSLAAPLTRTGTLLGTPAFMAPEQVRDPTRADARSDQFSLCVLVFEALYGERPFVDAAAAEAGAVRAVEKAEVPPALRAALVRGLQPAPADRWRSIEALLAAIDAAMVPRVRRRRWSGGWVAAVGLAFVAGMLVMMGVRGEERGVKGEMGGAWRRAGAEVESAVRTAQVGAQAGIWTGSARAVSWRFQAGKWLEVAPSLVGGDDEGIGVVIDAPVVAGTIAAWSLERASERVGVEWVVTPRCLEPGSMFGLRVGSAEAWLQGRDGGTALRCGEEVAAIAGAEQVVVRIEVGAEEVRCRVRGTTLRASAARSAGPLRLELRGAAGEQAACARVAVERVAVWGARPGPARPLTPLEQAAAALVDHDAAAVMRALDGRTEPQAELWRAIVAVRRGLDAPMMSTSDATSKSQSAVAATPKSRPGVDAQRSSLLAEPEVDRELQQWLRRDLQALGPGLRRMLGEAAYLGLVVRAWRGTLAAASWSTAAVRTVLVATSGLEAGCEGAACAPLLRARGRALAQVGDREAARRALEAALAAVATDAEGRALASQILVELTLVTAGERD